MQGNIIYSASDTGCTPPASLEEQIMIRSRAHGEECAFSACDFLDLASQKEVESALFSLYMKKRIVRVFDDAAVFVLSGDFTLDSVAEALCRPHNGNAVPCGVYALQKAGIAASAVSAAGVRFAEYVTDGPDKEFTGKFAVIRFHHKDFPQQGMLSAQSEFLIQILEAAGKEQATEKTLRQIRKNFSLMSLQKINSELKTAENVPRWIKDTVTALVKL